MKKFLLLVGLLGACAQGQVSNQTIIPVVTAPSGSCKAGLPNRQVISTGTQYSCQSVTAGVGTWGAIGGSGGANFPSTPGVVYNTSTSAARNAAPSDLLPLVGYYTGAYNGAVTYKFGDEASDGSGNNYVSLAAANTGNALTNTTWWHFLGGISSTITGGTCTNQFVRSINTVGVPACNSIVTADLPASGVAAGTYGSSTLIPIPVVDATGRITSISTVAAAGGSSGPFSQGQFFGDSLARGYFTSGLYYSSHPWWEAYTLQLPFQNYSNYGVNGLTTDAQDVNILGAPLTYLPTTLVEYTTGTNDINFYGVTTAAQTAFSATLEAQQAWMLIPTAQKTTFQGAGVTFTGTWTNETGGFVGKTTSSSGGTATFSVTGTNLYVITHAFNASTATGTITCSNGGPSAQALVFGSTSGLSNRTWMNRFTGMTAGSHSCVITQTSGSISVEWFAGFTTGTATTNFMLQGGTPPQSGTTNAAALTTYRGLESAAVTLLNGDGWTSLNYVDTSTVTTSAVYFPNDGTHGDAMWQYLLAQPYIAKINSVKSTAFVQAWIPQPVVDGCTLGNTSMCIGANNGTVATGLSSSLMFGFNNLQSITTATNCTAIGVTSMGSASGTCQNGTAVGTNSAQSVGANASGYTFVGQGSGLNGVSTVTDGGAFGNNSFIGVSGAWNIGSGSTCSTANSLCFNGLPIANTSGALNGAKYTTTTNCAAVGTSASPSLVACSAAPAGAFSCATTASAATCVISDTAVTANSEIVVQEVASESTRLGVTCNTAPTVTPSILLASKSAGTSFTINMPTITVNPACFDYYIVN